MLYISLSDSMMEQVSKSSVVRCTLTRMIFFVLHVMLSYTLHASNDIYMCYIYTLYVQTQTHTHTHMHSILYAWYHRLLKPWLSPPPPCAPRRWGTRSCFSRGWRTSRTSAKRQVEQRIFPPCQLLRWIVSWAPMMYTHIYIYIIYIHYYYYIYIYTHTHIYIYTHT